MAKWALLIGLLFFQALFLFFTELDLWVSDFFFDRVSNDWWLSDNTFVLLSYEFFRVLPFYLIPILIALFLSSKIFRKRSEAKLRKVLVFLLVVLLVGPGLVVHKFFKDESGRARPQDVSYFSGVQQFTPPFTKSNQCSDNCSFVSGHAAMGFFFIALSWVFNNPRWVLYGGATGFLVGFGRVVQGAHWASDILFGFFVVLGSALLISRLMFGNWWPDYSH